MTDRVATLELFGLNRTWKWLNARDRDDTLLTLVASGDLIAVERETAGPKTMRFLARRDNT